MDFNIIVDQLFKNDMGVARLHDAIFEACEVSHDDETLKKLFYGLPLNIQSIAFDEGTMADTVFGDEVYMHVKKEGEKYGKI